VLPVRGADVVETLDQLAVEEPLEIRLGGIAFTVTMRKPGDDETLVAEPLHSEGFIHGPDYLDVIARYRGPDVGPTPAAWCTYS
jgi:FdhD protein